MTRIFIGNLSFQTTEADLSSIFSSYGTVENVSVITDRMTGQPRGFAFIEMSDPKQAEAAISALNGTDLGGRTLNVNEARPKPDGPRFGNSGGYSRSGGRGDRPKSSRW